MIYEDFKSVIRHQAERLTRQDIVQDSEVFNPDLLNAQKYIMVSNGMFTFDDIPETICTCGHALNDI